MNKTHEYVQCNNLFFKRTGNFAIFCFESFTKEFVEFYQSIDIQLVWVHYLSNNVKYYQSIFGRFNRIKKKSNFSDFILKKDHSLHLRVPF